TVILQGTLYDPNADPPSEIINAEAAILAAAPVVDTPNNITTVTLKTPLAKSYVRAGAVLLANIVEATQGETVKDEVLGSGLLVTVNGVRWNEKPTLFDSPPDGQDYSAAQDDDEKTIVTFGDGVFG